MSVKSGRLPSPGFVAVIVTYLAVALFFVWALTTPPLQRVWEIHHLMKIGELYRLDEDDRALLQRAMAEHEDLARDLLDGHELGIVSEHQDGWITTPFATLLRTGESASVTALEIDVQAHDDLLPLTIVVRGESWTEQRRAKEHGPIAIPIPPPEQGAEIVEVELGGEKHFADASVIGVRVSWEVRP
jgi:hypothetical protein